MNKLRVIDLLNKIANGEEVPEKIKFYGKYYIWYDNKYTGNEGYCLEPVGSDGNSFLEINTLYDLNEEVEIIDIDYKEDKPITKESIEASGYACGEIKKLFESGWNKSIENKPLIEEDKKIEKLKDINIDYCRDGKLYEHLTKEEIALDIQTIRHKINEIIDKVNKEKE